MSSLFVYGKQGEQGLVDTGRRFDPTKYLRTIRTRNGTQTYLPVPARLLWLRTDHPNASVVTEALRIDDNGAVFKAVISIPNGGSAVGHGSETASDAADFIEKAETKAIGRALAALGYATEFAEAQDDPTLTAADTVSATIAAIASVVPPAPTPQVIVPPAPPEPIQLPATTAPPAQPPQPQRAERPTPRWDEQERPERNERTDRQEQRPERAERFDRNDRNDRNDRPERQERTERPDQRPERTDRQEQRPERGERFASQPRPYTPERPERPTRTERPERSERPAPADEPLPRPMPVDRALPPERLGRPRDLAPMPAPPPSPAPFAEEPSPAPTPIRRGLPARTGRTFNAPTPLPTAHEPTPAPIAPDMGSMGNGGDDDEGEIGDLDIMAPISTSAFWRWARSRGYTDKRAVEDAIGKSMETMTPREAYGRLREVVARKGEA